MNFNRVVNSEISKDKKCSQLFYAIDLMLTEIEKYIKNKYSSCVYIEKIAGSRIHCVIDENQNMGKQMIEVVDLSFSLINVINHSLKKTETLDDLVINMGADFGKYNPYEITFVDPAEDNSIGFPANIGAKLQEQAKPFQLVITKEVYNQLLPQISVKFRKMDSNSIRLDVKYGVGKTFFVYTKESNKFLNESFDFLKEQEEIGARFGTTIDNFAINNSRRILESINLKDNVPGEYKIENSAVLYCDIRGFTKKFASDGSNLKIMAVKTMESLEKMNDSTSSYRLTHIQFQGDRDLAIMMSSQSISQAISCAFSMIDSFKKHADKDDILRDMTVGIGIAYGTYYYAKVGMRGSKDPLLIGMPPIYAEIAEDKYAVSANSIALHKDYYDAAIKSPNKAFVQTIKDVFIRKDDYYVLRENVDSNEYSKHYRDNQIKMNANNQNQNGAKPWRP